MKRSFIIIAIALGIYGCSSAAIKKPPGNGANKIFLKAVTIDTDATPSLSVAGNKPVSENVRPGYYIVQFRTPVTLSMKQSIEQAGIRLLHYLPDNAFAVHVTDTAALARAGAIASVQWIGVYQSRYKVAPQLASLALSNAGRIVTVTIQVFRTGDVQAVQRAVQSASGTVITMSVSGTGSFLRAQIPAGQIQTIADTPDVEWIEPYTAPVLMNDVATDIIAASNNDTSITANGVWNDGYTGAGQAVAVADTGLDIGGTGGGFTYNAAYGDYESGNVTAPFHPAFIGKTIHAYALGRAGDFSDPNGHGTHVAGSLLGHDTQTSFSVAPYWGSAYGVNKLVFMSLLDQNGGLGGLPADLNTLFGEEYTDTLSPRIASNSWGAQVNGDYYDTAAEQVDTFLWNHPDMVILFAAGNAGVDTDGDGVVDLGSMASPATAKDIVSVGASENLRSGLSITYYSFGFTSYPLFTDPVANNINGMAAFSSRGPTPDGRIKPDVVAPGTAVISARSQQWLFNDDFQSGAGKWSVSPANTWELFTDGTGNTYERIVSNGSTLTGNLAVASAFDIRTAMADADLLFLINFNLTTSDQFSVNYYDADNHVYFPVSTLSNASGGSQWYVFPAPIAALFASHNYALNYNSANGYAMTQSQAQGFDFSLAFASSGTAAGTAYVDIDNVRVCPTGWGLLGLTSGLSITYGSQENENYILDGGTSMATPLAAGAAADVRQALVQEGLADPSAALIKAVLINGAVDMYPGQYGTGQYLEVPQAPNDVEGFGRINLVNSLISGTTRKIIMLDYKAGSGLTTGGMRISSVTLDNTTDPLKITLVWTDYPSTPSASVNIVNVLHFSVTTANNTAYYPNGLTGFDNTNNVQQVTIPSPQTGVYTVAVSGYNVPSGVSPLDDQPYAVVMSGDIQGVSSSATPGIGVSPGSLSFTAAAGSSTPLVRQVSISNTGSQGSTLNWNVQTGTAAWLTASPAGGTAPSVLTVTAQPAGLAAGTYTGSVVVSAANAANSPVSVPITLTLTSSQKSSSSNGCSCSTTGQGDPSDILFALLLLTAGFIVMAKVYVHGR